MPGFAQTLTLSAQSDASALRPISEHILKQAFQRAGLQVAFKRVPLERAIEEANDGVTDGDMHRIADVAKLYPNLISVPTAINKVSLVLYGRTPDILTKTRADIGRLKIAYPSGLLIQRKYSRGLDAVESRLAETTFDLLLNGRVDAVMMSYVDAEAQIAERRLQPPPVRWPAVWASEPLFLVLHRRHAALVPRLDTALKQMQHEGLIDTAYTDALRELKIPPLPDVPDHRDKPATVGTRP